MEYFPLVRPMLYALPPEAAHRIAIAALKKRLLPPLRVTAHPELVVHAFGKTLANPVGLAAGFDKNAESLHGLARQGFGFIEAGTLTPRPQQGNPKPRLFRLPEDRALINRMGFNNAGLDKACECLAVRPKHGVIGVNIGKNAGSEDAVSDYVECARRVADYADYLVLNVSSPNTQGLRDLQTRARLLELIRHVRAVLDEKGTSAPPLLVKIAPDLDPESLESIAEIAVSERLGGLIVTNTTITRPITLHNLNRAEQGGLSGAPLFQLSTDVLASLYRLTKGQVMLIGVGGISTAEQAYAKIRAGASLVQIYTVLIYEGFSAVRRINDGLAALLKADGFASVKDAVGSGIG